MPRIPDPSLSLPSDPYLLVTVGTTKFESLIEEINLNASTLLKICQQLDINTILLQIGNSTIEPKQLELAAQQLSSKSTMSVTWVSYATNFQSFLQNASLVISHAGAGSILETLRAQPQQGLKAPRLFVVVND